MEKSPKDDVTRNSGSGSNRRELLKKTLALGTAGYVAPMIVGSVTTVSAQVISGALVCQQVEPDCATFSCVGGCACVTTTEAATICVEPTCVSACTTTADCPSGSVCFTLGCCGPATFCVPLCTGAAPDQRAAPWAH